MRFPKKPKHIKIDVGAGILVLIFGRNLELFQMPPNAERLNRFHDQ